MRRRLAARRRRVVAVTGAATAVALLLRKCNAGRAAPTRMVGAFRGLPGLRSMLQKETSRLIYGFASRAGADPGMAFLNYGYAPLESDAEDRDPTALEDPDRSGAALYERVAAGAPLRGRDVLEVGCGRGGGAAFIFEHYGPRSMLGLDLASSAVERGRRDYGRPRLEFVQGDAEALPFDDASFDVVLNVESAHWYPDVGRFLDEVFRVLRPGGLLLLADVRYTNLPEHGDDKFMPRVDMRAFIAQLNASPFVMLEQEDITDNVRRALEIDTPRRRQMIERSYPRLLRRQALAFSGVMGTPVYEGLAKGDLTYRRFVLQKSPPSRSRFSLA
jgi:SAM-dependent methyltransferase